MEGARVAVIGGTGHYEGSGAPVTSIEPDVDGRLSSPVDIYDMDGTRVAFLARHGREHQWLPHEIDYRANVRALASCGVETVVALNAVGGITEAVAKPGTLVIPHQLIDHTWGRPSTFGNELSGADLMARHVDFTDPFSPDVRDVLIRAAARSGISVVDQAVYAATQGPRLETAAEIDRLERDGCDIVGMTAMPEAALARELEMGYATIATVVNAAAGRGEGPIDWATIEAAQQVAASAVDTLLVNVLKEL